LITRYAWIEAGHASARNWRAPLEIPEQQEQPVIGSGPGLKR